MHPARPNLDGAHRIGLRPTHLPCTSARSTHCSCPLGSPSVTVCPAWCQYSGPDLACTCGLACGSGIACCVGGRTKARRGHWTGTCAGWSDEAEKRRVVGKVGVSWWIWSRGLVVCSGPGGALLRVHCCSSQLENLDRRALDPGRAGRQARGPELYRSTPYIVPSCEYTGTEHATPSRYRSSTGPTSAPSFPDVPQDTDAPTRGVETSGRSSVRRTPPARTRFRQTVPRDCIPGTSHAVHSLSSPPPSPLPAYRR